MVTIEGLTLADGDLSPIQRAMVEHHGSQCGYCTPGVVAALAGLFEAGTPVDQGAARAGLTGNLCRCTGYLPILEAALAVDQRGLERLGSRYASREMVAELEGRAAVPLRLEQGGRIFCAPLELSEAVAFRVQHPDAVIVSGGTETGLERNKRGTEPRAILSLSRIRELGRVSLANNLLSVGASVTWTDLEQFSRGKLPLVENLTERFGSPQIRNAGTLVGNIAYGSPVADSTCFLLVLGATLEVAGPSGVRRTPVDGFVRGPKLTALGAGEIITRVVIPLPGARDRQAIQDIQAQRNRHFNLSGRYPDRSLRGCD